MSLSEISQEVRHRRKLDLFFLFLPRERALFPLFGKEGPGEISAVTVYFHISEKNLPLQKLVFLHMTSLVPQPDYRFGRVIMFIGQRTQARRAQQKVSTARRFEPEPASAEHAQKVAAGKKQHVCPDSA
jgi:hypothetical protein